TNPPSPGPQQPDKAFQYPQGKVSPPAPILQMPDVDRQFIRDCRVRQAATAVSKNVPGVPTPPSGDCRSYALFGISLSQRRKRGEEGQRRTEPGLSRGFTKMVTSVIAAFALCWAPYHVFCLIEVAAQYWQLQVALVEVGLPMATFFAFLNPVYVFSCPNFCVRIRQSLGELMEGLVEEGGMGGSRGGGAGVEYQEGEEENGGELTVVTKLSGDSGVSGDPSGETRVTSPQLSIHEELSMANPSVFKEGDLTKEEDIRTGEVVCDVCEVKAVKSCLTCNQCYCETHVRKHYTVPKLQRHTLVEVTGDLEERLCQEHHRALEVFCRTDQKLICSLCVVTEHKGHDVVYEEIKQAGRQTQGEEQHQNQVLNEEVQAPGDLKVDQLKPTSLTISWSKAHGMEQIPHHFLIRVARGLEGSKIQTQITDPQEEYTEYCHRKCCDLQPGTEYTVSVSTVLKNGEQSEPVSTTICTNGNYQF
ncbi:uncharacterized protein LOC121536025, partial [Coregonus clupeaformis]|uniref:uncharacterized protein LOC121536025 n=1 Tax=Coregonus clupeaformis TaxID=59861 RepID=UPI001E1C3724